MLSSDNRTVGEQKTDSHLKENIYHMTVKDLSEGGL